MIVFPVKKEIFTFGMAAPRNIPKPWKCNITIVTKYTSWSLSNILLNDVPLFTFLDYHFYEQAV